MPTTINFGTEFSIIEITNESLDDILNYIKKQSIPYQVYFVYDSKNKKLYTYSNEKKQFKHSGFNLIDPTEDNQPYVFAYGKNRDKYISIIINDCIEIVKVWTKEKMKTECIYNSKWKLFSGNISEVAI